jgi:hypothetical protein
MILPPPSRSTNPANKTRRTNETAAITPSEEVEVTQPINETTRTAAVTALRELAISEVA